MLCASSGTAVDMSLDHKPTDSPELERIVRAGGQVGADSRVNGGLNLSRAIGRCTLHILLSWKYMWRNLSYLWCPCMLGKYLAYTFGNGKVMCCCVLHMLKCWELKYYGAVPCRNHRWFHLSQTMLIEAFGFPLQHTAQYLSLFVARMGCYAH